MNNKQNQIESTNINKHQTTAIQFQQNQPHPNKNNQI